MNKAIFLGDPSDDSISGNKRINFTADRCTLPLRTLLLIMSLIFIAAISSEAEKPYVYKPADANQIKNQGSEPVLIMPATFLREYDPVTVMFNREMHREGSGPIDKPEQFITIKPEHPGEYRWLDSRTIEFRPTVPWQAMQSYNIKAQGITKVLTALLIPPQNITPASGSTGLDPVSRIALQFSQAVKPEVLSKLVTFEVCPLPGIESKNCHSYTSADYTIKVSERSGRNAYIYWFIFKKPIQNGLRIRTIVRLAEDPALSDAKRIYFFDTRKEFTIERAGSYEYQFTLNPAGSSYGRDQAIRLSNESSLIVDFSAQPASLTLSQVKSLLNFSPAPRKIDWSLSDTRLTVRLSIDQERLYNVVLSPVGIVDRDGRTLLLKRQCSFFCYQPRDQQFARWGIGSGLVEQFGPQHFPFLVSGVKSVDVRVYKIDPLHKAFWPFPNSAVNVSETTRPPGPGEEPISEEQILSPLNPYEISDHIRMLGSPHYSAVIDLDKEGVTRFQSFDLRPLFEKISGADRPGTYLVGFRTLDGSDERSYVRVQATDLCLSTIESKSQLQFTVTSFSKGKPVSDAEILIEGLIKDKFVVLTKGTTNSDGMLIMEHNEALQKSFKISSIKRVTVHHNDDFLVLDSRSYEAPPVFANNHWYSDRSTWLEWLSNDRYDYRQDHRCTAFVFSERPIYRPNEPVFIKGYIRTLFHGAIEKPEQGVTFTMRVLSPAGTQFDFPIKLSGYYSFNDSLIEKDLPTGDYQVQVLRSVPNQGESEIASTSFAVDAYRIPKFEVKVFGPDKVPNDRPATVRLSASYYAGGKVSGQNVSWKVVSYPYSYISEIAAGYIMSTDNKYGAVEEERQQGVIEQTDVTGDDGQSTIVVNPQSATNGNARKYVCEATVTDVDEQTVSSRHTLLALPPFALGLKVERHITGTSIIKANVVAVGINGKFEPGHKINVQLKKMSWISYLQETDFSRGKPKYLTHESIDLVEEKTLTTTGDPLSFEFKNQEPGVYVLEISSRDKLGRLQLVKADLFLAGNKPVTWKKGDQLIFETVPDRTGYEPGQQAKILLKSPFQRAMALAIIEHPSGNPEYRWVEIADGQGVLVMSITQEMAPRIPVNFLLMRPRISNEKRLPDGSTIDAGKPQTFANTTWLTVEQIENTLDVTLEHPQMVRPGTRMDMSIVLKDAHGKPRDGEVALWLVDEAVLSLAKEKPLNPLPSFTDEITSHVTLRDSRNMAFGDLRISETPGGDGFGEGDDLFGKVTVRKNFKTVPYYNPSVIIDKTGRATVNFTMSDDLTNFAVRAVAVSGSDRFGVGKSQVRVRLPLIVQPSLPRFVRFGDKIKAGGVARVLEGPGGAGMFTIETQGLKSTTASRPLDIMLDKVKPLSLLSDLSVADVEFDSAGNPRIDSVMVKIAVVRTSDKASDAFSVKIPLRSDRPVVSDELFTEVTQNKPFSISALPVKVRSGTLTRQILVSDQMTILKAVAGMQSLIGFPHGCTEQRVSRAFPAIVYRDIWAKYGLDAPEPDIRKDVAATVDYLSRVQTPDGLFGYWPGSTGYLYLTAYVVEFLSEVKQLNDVSKTGYSFNDEMYNKAIEALKRGLRTDYSHFLSGYVYYERSAALLALAKAGQLDIGYARELSSQTGEVDIQSQARVLEALQKNGTTLGTELQNLSKRLWDQTVFKLQSGKEVFGGLQERSFRIGAQVHAGEITSLAAMVSAFSGSSRRSEKLPMLVKELLTLGGNGDWGSTQANSLALLAIRNYINKPIDNGQITASLAYGNTSRKISYETKQGALTYEWSDPQKTDFSILTNTGNNPCYVRFAQRYLPLEPGSSAPAVQKGFVVKRELLFVGDGKGTRRLWLDSAGTGHNVKQGDIIEERIQVQNPKDRFFVAVSAPFAAGLEYMNPRLETSGENAKPLGATTNSGDYQAYLDDQVAFYFERMPAGTYDFFFRLKATVEGDYSHPSARAEMMYDMSTYGCSPGARIVVQASK